MLTDLELDLAPIALGVFCEMLGLPAQSLDDFAGLDEPLVWRARIQVFGAWKAVVDIEAAENACRAIAGRMFSIHANDVGEDDLRDALGEIANMLAGNLKGIKEGMSTLSIPEVSRWSPDSGTGSDQANDAAYFEISGSPLQVCVSRLEG
jgi:chemotaxis protein CheX